MRSKYSPLQVVPSGIGSAENVTYCSHGVKVQGHARELVFDLPLRLIEGVSSRHQILRIVISYLATTIAEPEKVLLLTFG